MIKIPAETLVRLCHISRDIRLEDGVAVTTDKMIMAAEVISSFEGTYHITVTPELLAQCEKESAFAGSVEIMPQDALRYTIAKTTMGFITGNIGQWPDAAHHIHRWRSIFAKCAEPLTHSSGNMVWNADTIALLARTSPSGILVFEEYFDVRNRPIMVRDAHTGDWCGCFMGYLAEHAYFHGATLPTWLRVS